MFLAWLGCSTVAGLLDGAPVDSDQDGLTDDVEEELGLDPSAGDSDGDRLADGDELDLGTDPALPDTDGDSYLDGDEVTEGKDPLDPTSVIYTGGWPYWWDKRSLPGAPESAEVGEPFVRFVLEDQFGELVHLGDFYGDDDRPVLVVVCAMWEPIGPSVNTCDLLPVLVRGDHALSPYYAEYDAVFAAIAAGDAHLVTVVGENADGSPPTSEDIEAQAARHLDVPGPVLLDPDYRVVGYVKLGVWLSVFPLDPELTLVDTGDWADLDSALATVKAMLESR